MDASAWRVAVACGETELGLRDWVTGMRDAADDRRIDEVLFNSSDGSDFEVEAKGGDSLDEIVERGDALLDGAGLNAAVAVRLRSGRIFIGEFEFRVREATEDDVWNLRAEFDGADGEDS